ncbi:MAG: flagellar export chaperone FliS [Ectothiorhodospiraceae bacterium]|nr:flagellar export chaperone FliS [Ectothiorhodospiraceae bacterium]
MKAAVNAYQNVQIDAAVLGASPHELIAKLLAKSIESIAEAKGYMIKGDIPNKSAHLQIAMSIISDGLRGSLDMEAGGEIAENLDSLYEYMLQRLMSSHAGNDPALLDEVAALLRQIKSGWDGIKP